MLRGIDALASGAQIPPDDYLHWDDLRHRTPPSGLDHETWWALLKLRRNTSLRDLTLRDTAGRPFRYAMPDAVIELLHRIDQNASGRISVSEVVTNPATRDRYVVSSLTEEAITSSQLEGAATTRQVAKELLRSGRAPRNRSEQMIANNYRAMQHVRELAGLPLTPDRVLEIHRIVCEGTMPAEHCGRLQAPDDERIVVEWRDGTRLHTPPPAAELPDRLASMCEFANGNTPRGFLHPVVRAVLLHFWLAYEHPFEDGNGRTARALFYWSMLAQGYWLAEFTTISSILLKAPARYARSFLLTETDDNDLTYFLLYQLQVFVRAITELHAYLERKMAASRATEQLLRETDLNDRQIALVSHALRHSGFQYTIQSHRHSHGIAYETARTDLLSLTRLGLLDMRKRGRAFVFVPAADLAARAR